MASDEQTYSGYFSIARERADIPFPEFYDRYYRTERPVVIEGVAADWPGRNKWTADYLVQALSKEPTAVAGTLWYWMDRGAMQDDYAVPELVDRIYQSNECFPRTKNIRIWVHPGGNISPWHYDVDLVNIFNVQVTGKKEWFLMSPRTPPRCYPFCNYAIIDSRGERMLEDKSYTRFFLNAGDMVYVPPCWYHRVISCDPENISLNWAMTNRKTSVTSPAMAREIEIYTIQDYLKAHRYEFVRKLNDRIYFSLPDFLRNRWHYDEMIDTPYTPSRLALWKRLATELAAFGPTFVYSRRAYAAVRGARYVRRLEAAGSPQ